MSDPSTTTSGDIEAAKCPYVARRTRGEYPKGAGLCRSMHVCQNCQQPFESFG